MARAPQYHLESVADFERRVPRYRPESIVRASGPPIARDELLAGDPDWPEFKRRWAELYGDPEFGR